MLLVTRGLFLLGSLCWLQIHVEHMSERYVCTCAPLLCQWELTWCAIVGLDSLPCLLWVKRWLV